MKKNKTKIEGVISVSTKGTGYVSMMEKAPTPGGVGVPTKSVGKDIEIDFRHLYTALHGDTVEILLHPKSSGRQTGEVSSIIKRAKVGFAGVLETENNILFLKPDDTKMYTDILIPEKSSGGAKIGEKVFAEIVSWENRETMPKGRITKIFGRPGDNEAEMQAIAKEKGFDSGFPANVEKEADILKKRSITKEDYNDRRDFRKILTFTIDPADAKDFDDAISFNKLSEDEFEIGIHIADVTQYVKLGSELDREARARGTSVYLVDRTIPMLPETLSNDLCSLVPGKDRLAMSAVFVLDKEARVKKQWFGRAVIHSQKRFTYEEAETSIKTKTAPLFKGAVFGIHLT
ncbi:MAG: RNB domain-containing ribonuclease, partial [Patescibacteria group bacterium]